LIVVADDQRTLIAATEQAPTDNAVVSETTAIAEVATSQVALDITLLTQRQKRDVQGVMAKMLGNRVGRLDTLLTRKPVGKRAGGWRRSSRCRARSCRRAIARSSSSGTSRRCSPTKARARASRASR